MANMKEAKGACALEAVKLLHSIGELDDHLFPKSRSKQNNELLNDKELFKHWKKVEEGAEHLFGAGTKKRRREHDAHVRIFSVLPFSAEITRYFYLVPRLYDCY
jgi:Dicer dimerisation domain